MNRPHTDTLTIFLQEDNRTQARKPGRWYAGALGLVVGQLGVGMRSGQLSEEGGVSRCNGGVLGGWECGSVGGRVGTDAGRPVCGVDGRTDGRTGDKAAGQRAT